VTIIACVLLLLFITPLASAYIDPGTGSFIIQIVLAGILAGSLSAKIFWKKIKTFLASIAVRKKKNE
jgi:hypothetical protein